MGDKWAIGEIVGSGRITNVHRGTNLATGEEVAIRGPKSVERRGRALLAQRQFDLQIAGAVRREHSGILPILGYSRLSDEGAAPALVTPLVLSPGIAGPMSTSNAIATVVQLLEALEYIHDDGKVHMDVRPGSITGIGADARFLDTLHALPAGKRAISRNWERTLGYAAPEVLRREKIDHRVDVYAAGALLVHLVTGGPVFDDFAADPVMMLQVLERLDLSRDDETTVVIAHHHLNTPPTAIEDLPEEVASVVHRALAKDPADRWPTAEAMREALR